MRNNGDGTFTDVTAAAHLGDSGWHSGCAVGDYNNDGFLDIYVTSFGPNKLYLNQRDGTFKEVAKAAGVDDPHWGFVKWSMGAAFGDYDNDGYVDLYVANFVKYDPQNPPPRPTDPEPCRFRGAPVVCEPEHFEGEQAILYHNNGNGTFTEVSKTAGILQKTPGRGFGAVFADFNNDGRPDIYQVNDSGPNLYYINNGDGTFRDASWASGLAADWNGNPQGTMGVTVGDFNNDGLLDVFISNWIEQSSALYVNAGSHIFDDKTPAFGLLRLGYEYCGWGTGFFDFDNDGWLDLWVTYGETNEALEKVGLPNPFAQPNYLMRNNHGKKWEDVSAAAGLRKLKKRVGRGTAFADIDNDGDIDVLVINKNDFPTLLRNDGGNRNNWLTIRTEGVRSNRAGIGARIAVVAGGMRRIFEVRSSESYLSGNDLRVHAGMGDLKRAERVEIRWPSGQVDRYADVEANRFYLAREGSWLRPDPLVHRAKPRRPRVQRGR